MTDIPNPGDELPDSWWENLVIDWAEYDERGVPSDLQNLVTDEDITHRILCVGEHPEHGLFLCEVLDQGNSPPYFVGWWSMLRDTMAPGTPISILDRHLDQILKQPVMFCITLSALESVIWTLLKLRADLHPGPSRGCYSAFVRDVYSQRKVEMGVKGPGVVSEHFGRADSPSEHPKALRFYREWAHLTRDRQDRLQGKEDNDES